MNNEPILFVQYARQLPDGRFVLAGPSYRGFLFHWTSRVTLEVNLYSPRLSTSPDAKGMVCCNEPQLLSSSELIGYDPASTEYPTLRRLQGYTSAMVAIPKLHVDLIGLLTIPAHLAVQVKKITARVFLNVFDDFDIPLMQEVFAVPDAERIIFRLQGDSSSFIIIPVRSITEGLVFTSEATIVWPSDSAALVRGELYTLLPFRQEGTRRTEYREINIGNVVVISEEEGIVSP